MADMREERSFLQIQQKTLAVNPHGEAPPTQDTEKFTSLPVPTATPNAGLDVEIGAAIEKDPFEVHWTGGDADPLNPRSFPYIRKWLINLVVSVSGLCVTFTSSVYTSTFGQITQEFGVSNLVATIGLSIYVIGLALGPMFLGPLSEFYGRRPIYLASFAFFLIWMIPEAVAKNIETMLIGRFFCGLSGSAFMAVAGGTVGDLFNHEQLQAPMVMFTTIVMVGPSFGPVVGGFINQYTSWRWTFYVVIIWSVVNLAFLALLVPETYHPVLLRNKARQLRKDTGNTKWIAPIEKMKKSIPRTIAIATTRPFELLIFEPMCLNLCIFSAILLGIVYLFLGAFDVVFTVNYGFTLSQLGLSFLGLFIGMLCGAACDPIVRMNYVRLIRQREAITGEIGGREPEYRLPPAMVGSILVPTGLFIFAWTCFPGVHWIVPIIGSAIFSMGSLFVFTGIFTFLVDAYPLYAASALAANTFLRCIFAGAFPLFGVQMYCDHWATSLLAFFTLAMMPFPYLFFKYGKKIRERSRFASA